MSMNEFDRVVFENKADAEIFLDQLKSMMWKDKCVTLYDYYCLAGFYAMTIPADMLWGWITFKELNTVTIKRNNPFDGTGYYLDMPPANKVNKYSKTLGIV